VIAITLGVARLMNGTHVSAVRSSSRTSDVEAGSCSTRDAPADYVEQLERELDHAKQQLAEMERRVSDVWKTLEVAFDTTQDCVEIIDREYRVLQANQASLNLWGLTPMELIGSHCYEVHYEANEPCANCPATQVFRSGLPFSVALEGAAWRKDLNRWQVTSYPLKDEHGRVTRVVNFAANLTKKRWHEALTLQAVRVSAVGELAAGIAHQINNPLTAILGNAQLLLREFDPSHSAWAALQTIERAGLRTSAIVKTLLSFSHQREYSFAQTDVNRTIQDALGLISHQVRRGGVSFIMQLADDLPLICASGPHLETVWMNLLLNARDAIGEDRDGEIRVITERSEDRNEIRIYISDNGHGIPPEHMDRVFDPFFTTKELSDGMGLGLFICYSVVTKHKGRIEVDSRLGEGSTFRVSLPADGWCDSTVPSKQL